MGVCIYCGNSAGIFRKVHKRCKVDNKAAKELITYHIVNAYSDTVDLSTVETEISNITTSHLISQSEVRQSIINGWERAVEQALHSGILTREKELKLCKLKDHFSLLKGELDTNSVYSKLVQGAIARNKITPTKKQLEFLKKHDVTVPSGATQGDVSKLISRKIEELNQGKLISDRQFEHIHELGGIPNRSMTYNQASQFIEYLHDHGTKCNKCDANDDRRSFHCPHCGAFLPKRQPLKLPKHIFQSE